MLTSIGDVMREAYSRGLITARDGNVSVRRGDSFYITPSGVRKSTIIPESIIKGKIINGKVVFKNKTDVKPSGEFLMHELLQTTDDFKGCRTVLHLHPTAILGAMYKGFNLQELSNEFPEVSRYTRVGPNIPILPVTSEILANSTYQAMTEIPEFEMGTKILYDIVGQANHGCTVIGKSPWDCFHHLERLEHICQIVLASGVSPK